MSFFYPTRWQNPYHPRYHNSSMYGLGAWDEQYQLQQAGAHNFTADQQAIAAEIDFFLRAAAGQDVTNAMGSAIQSGYNFSQEAVDFINAWQREAAKAYGGILNINPQVPGQAGEQNGYDVIWGMMEGIGKTEQQLKDSDVDPLNKVYEIVMTKYPQKPLRSANLVDLQNNFSDLIDAYYDRYFSENPAVQKKPVRRFGWGKYLLWGGLALCGVLLIAGAMKARR